VLDKVLKVIKGILLQNQYTMPGKGDVPLLRCTLSRRRGCCSATAATAAATAATAAAAGAARVGTGPAAAGARVKS